MKKYLFTSTIVALLFLFFSTVQSQNKFYDSLKNNWIQKKILEKEKFRKERGTKTENLPKDTSRAFVGREIPTPTVPDLDSFPSFIPYDIGPKIIKRIEPVYPDTALKNKLEGVVYVKAWLDTLGKVKKVRLTKSDDVIFIRPALEAAKQFIFSPAIMKGHPVEVSVDIPFKFKLK
ncbi:MAG: energy transducer TonB [Ignavibacteriales bacterium]|nr:energy transducer TonB [Ignavibacteriales bacterium]